MHKHGVVIGLIGLMALIGCHEVNLEQQAAEAAQSNDEEHTPPEQKEDAVEQRAYGKSGRVF